MVSLIDTRPRLGFLKLKSQIEQFPFVTEGGAELNTEGKPIRTEAQRQRYSRSIADVLKATYCLTRSNASAKDTSGPI